MQLAAAYSMVARLYGNQNRLDEQLRSFQLASDVLASLMDDFGTMWPIESKWR